jgi:thiol:disulfide interchange protein
MNFVARLCIVIFLISCFNSVESGLCWEGFDISATLRAEKGRGKILLINFSVPGGHYIYADKMKVAVKQPPDVLLVPDNIPEPTKQTDPFFNKTLLVYTENFSIQYKVKNLGNNKHLNIEVSYQGCNRKTCFMPASKIFQLTLLKESSSSQNVSKGLRAVDPDEKLDWKELAGSFKISKRLVGYADVDEFLNFIDPAKADGAGSSSGLLERFNKGSIWLALILILLGGLALNLTPCVLPVIPVNIAIIGAGAEAGSKIRGFSIGLIYACGIALAYGIVGGVVVITGSTFGALNSSPWFNLGIALIFIILALAMFDIFSIDFSRFQPVGRSNKNKGFLIIFFMGSVSALLAGACVAPVVIAMLVFASQVYSQGNILGIFMPFFLGIGMGTPWPFVGAGLSLLPRPGKWMLGIKRIFAVIILLSGFYYGHLAYGIYKTTQDPNKTFYGNSTIKIDDKSWHDNLGRALELADKEKKA